MWIYIGIGLFIYLCGFYAGWWLAHEYIGAPEVEEEFRAVPPNQKIDNQKRRFTQVELTLIDDPDRTETKRMRLLCVEWSGNPFDLDEVTIHSVREGKQELIHVISLLDELKIKNVIQEARKNMPVEEIEKDVMSLFPHKKNHKNNGVAV